MAAVVLPASAGGVVIAGAWYLARWHSVGSTDQVQQVPVVVVACDGPGPPGRSAGMHTRRSGGHVEVPDSSRGRSGAPFVRAERPSRKDT